MAKDKLKTIYVCTNCGETSPRWLGRCPSCGAWNTMTEDVVAEPAVEKPVSGRLENMPLKDFTLAQEQLDLVYLQRALNEAHGNKKVASGLLGLTYDQFRGLYRKYKNMLVLG